MRTYTSIILLALVLSSLVVFSQQSSSISSNQSLSYQASQTATTTGQFLTEQLVSIQTEEYGDKAPNRGSGRRQFF